jgi:hypothetical protein
MQATMEIAIDDRAPFGDYLPHPNSTFFTREL